MAPTEEVSAISNENDGTSSTQEVEENEDDFAVVTKKRMKKKETEAQAATRTLLKPNTSIKKASTTVKTTAPNSERKVPNVLRKKTKCTELAKHLSANNVDNGSSRAIVESVQLIPSTQEIHRAM